MDLIRLRTRPELTLVAEGRTVLSLNRDGWLAPEPEVGLFIYEARLLSRWRVLVNGIAPAPNALSAVDDRTWLGYYLTPPQPRPGQAPLGDPPQYALEIKIARRATNGMHEDLDITNYTGQEARFTLALEADADFADLRETHEPRKQQGDKHVSWRDGILSMRYHVERDYDQQGDRGHARVDAETEVRVIGAGSRPRWANGRIFFDVCLAPRARWHACFVVSARYVTHVLRPGEACYAFSGGHDDKRARFLAEATGFGPTTLAGDVHLALARAREDLLALRLYDLDVDDDAWVPAAGLPTYDGLFGRDSLTAAWQAALLSPSLMQGVLPTLARFQGRRFDDWRDEQPGRMLHQARTGPLSLLEYDPFSRDYSGLTASGVFPTLVGSLWHWTGDRARVEPLVEPALRALASRDRYGDLDGDGFCEYLPRSKKGPRNQGWKDSDDAIVYADGRQAKPPIAVCEEQGYTYGAKQLLSTVLWQLGRRDEARRLLDEAEELKKRFNDAFWMEEEQFFALGLDPDKRHIDAIASNPGLALASGILDDARVAATVRRLFAPDLFSGWGVRTLSSENPAYNPVSYQRGTVWPAEQATLAFGLYRYGLRSHAALLCRRQFELTRLFQLHRLPECVGGHPRDGEHPFPGLYPKADWPQAWSASAPFLLIQSLLGLYPMAPLELLFVDPELPEWLPELTLHHLRVGAARVSLRFFRDGDGHTDYQILELEGRLRVIRQPSPWSLTTGIGERIQDLLESLS